MTRRRLRETGETAIVSAPGSDEPAPAAESASAPERTDAEASVSTDVATRTGRSRRARTTGSARARTTPSARAALAWIAPGTVTAETGPSLVAGDLLARRPHRSPVRPGVIAPLLIALLVVAAYAATTLAWPLNAVTPTVTPVGVTTAAAPPTAPAWPATGTAAVSIQGIADSTIALTGDAVSIASITKVVTALMVLDEEPLAVGESGPSFQFGYDDQDLYYEYLDNGESALDVPVEGSLTELQLLQGMLIGSANNYAARLADDLWPNDTVFANAAADWLQSHALGGITIVEPTGIEGGNAASPAALIALAQRALANPVVAQIVATPVVELPGAGIVENTNELLADPGVIGIKTGTLEGWNLLAAKDVVIGATTVRLYASVLNQPDDATRFAATRALFDQLTAELQLRPSVTAGTRVGVVTTAWGATADVVAASDASVVLFNGGSATVNADLDLGDSRTAEDVIGTLTVTGPLDTAVVDTELTSDIEPPTALWRLTHPLELFGLAG